MTYTVYADLAEFYMEKEVSTAPLPAMHQHRTYELYYLVKGEREYFIEDRFFKVEAGDLVLIPRKVLHRTAGEGGLRFLVHFTDAFLQKYFSEAVLEPLMGGLPFVFRPEEKEHVHIQSILETMLAQYTGAQQKQSSPDWAMMAGYLYQLLFTMVYKNNTYVPYEYADARITRIIRYINDNLGQISGVEQIAEQFYITKHHLCRLFKKKLGISLISYVNAIKIRKACSLIKNGNTNLTQVALDCGFNSHSYFCKVFKSEKGMSPTKYKKRHLG